MLFFYQGGRKMDGISPEDLEKTLLKYKFAKKILEAELEVVLKEYEYKYHKSPIEHIKSRIKSEKSIIKKLKDRGYEVNIENVENHIHDIVGFRIICSFLSDVYDIVDVIKKSKNFKIKDESDYIRNPKESGYSSYHLNVLVPVHLDGNLQYVEAEIQIRTMAMDFWATLDHKLRYKLPEDIPVHLQRELLSCSDEIKVIDTKMQRLYDIVKKYTD